MTMDQVFEDLWISDIETARVCNKDPFDVVITVCQDSIADNVGEGTEYHYFNMADGAAEGYGGDSSYELFEESAETLLDYLERDNTVLIHCHMGQSRSVAVAIAALSVYDGKPLLYERGRISQHRPQIHPDETLMEHASQFVTERGGTYV